MLVGGLPQSSVVVDLLNILWNFLLPDSLHKARHDYFNVFSKSVKDIRGYLSPDIKRARVLVLGCGYAYPEVILWSSVAREVVGVDVRQAFWRHGHEHLYHSLRDEGKGFGRALFETLYRRNESTSYLKALLNLANLSVESTIQDVVSYDGKRLPFSDSTFDVVCSNAVLEHVENLNNVCGEILRVLDDSGISYHLWHNFYSLSGGHVSDRMAELYPWGHLTESRAVKEYMSISGTYLNELRPDEVLGVLERYFDTLAYYQVDRNHNKKDSQDEFSYEGATYLTDDILQRLSPLDRETLLTRAYLHIGRKVDRCSRTTTVRPNP